MYSFDSRVRYSEVDEYRKLSLTGVINYMQDCSTFQSEDLNMGIDYLAEKHRAWLLSSWQIVVECGGSCVWDSGKVESASMRTLYGG